MGKEKRNEFKLEEVYELLEAIAKREQPFWGETAQQWQAGKIILFKEVGIRKPE